MRQQYVIDSSSLIRIGEVYPKTCFGVNSWVMEMINKGVVIVIPKIRDELKRISEDPKKKIKVEIQEIYEDVRKVLDNLPKKSVFNDTEIADTASEIERELGLSDIEEYGLSDEDLFLIASAKVHRSTVVTEELVQQGNFPNEYYKIPRACEIVGVNCVNLFGLFESEKVFFDAVENKK